MVLAGAQASTTCSPSTKHSGSVLPWLSGTQSSSSESLRTKLRGVKKSKWHHERYGVIMAKPGRQCVALRQPISQRACKAALLERNSLTVTGRKGALMGRSVRDTKEPSPVHDGQAAALSNDSGAWDHVVL